AATSPAAVSDGRARDSVRRERACAHRSHLPLALRRAAPAGGNGTSSHGPKGGRPAGHHRPAANVRPAASPIHAGPTQETVPWQWLALHEQQWRLKGGRIRAAPLGPVRPHPVSSASHPGRGDQTATPTGTVRGGTRPSGTAQSGSARRPRGMSALERDRDDHLVLRDLAAAGPAAGSGRVSPDRWDKKIGTPRTDARWTGIGLARVLPPGA